MSSVIALSDTRRHYLHRKEKDMRKSFDSLCGIISNELGRPVLDGDIFIFINKPRTHLKLLLWERGGFTLFYRRLEQGTFEVPAFDHDAKSMQLSADLLLFMLNGSFVFNATISTVAENDLWFKAGALCCCRDNPLSVIPCHTG